LWLLGRLRRAGPAPEHDGYEPSVSIIIAAHNEETVIEDKIRNTLSLDYPAHKLQVLVGSDGSTDRTENLARRHEPAIMLVRSESQVGKTSILNLAVDQASGEILLFTDANVLLQPDAVRNLVRHFVDPRVGCAVGRVTYWNHAETGIAEGEGLYWRYELGLREAESKIGNLAMGSGPIMALRARLFAALDPDVQEDFVLPLRVVTLGCRCIYDHTAVSQERLYQSTSQDMFASKARIVCMDLRGLLRNRRLLNPCRYPLVSWALLSHKLLRWLVPYFLIALFGVNLLLVHQPFYRFTLIAQVVCYALAGAGYLWQRTGRKPPLIVGIPSSFCLVNAAAAVGVARFLMGNKSGRWTPVRPSTHADEGVP